MVKVLDTYQQTFICSALKTSQKFRFSRVFKKDPSNHIKLSVSQASYYTNVNTKNIEPHLLFLTGLPELTGKCNVLDIYQNVTNEITSNKMLLAVLGDNVEKTTGGQKTANFVSQPVSFIMNELPLGEFEISLTHLSRTITDACEFLVSFQIDVCEY